jgi:hypothetical protein
MGCLGHRKKQIQELADTKWEYINLNDFKASGCGTQFAYGYLCFLLLISVAVYVVDVFTAVNLLVFNRWASQVKPAISFDILRIIFSVCIILSIINLVYEYIRAYRVIKRSNVAECYLDSLAARWESIRWGRNQGFKRFLVFASLTKSKKGTEYIALFTYFSFQTWFRVIICSGPRQVVNAITLKSVYEANFIINNKSVEGSISEFFQKIKFIAEDDYRQALILSGMLFTLVIWVFSMLFLILAVLFYVLFLFHWIPRADGGLSGYCARKVNKALLKIVTEKVNKALAKGQQRAEKKNGGHPGLERAATLPTLPNMEMNKPDSLPTMPMLNRNDTMTTLPAYTPAAATATFELGHLDQKRPAPSRTATMASTATYSSRAPLASAAADMGYGRSASPAPSLPAFDPVMFPPRPGTSNSQRSVRSATSRPGPRNFGPQSSYQESLNGANVGSYNRPAVQQSFSNPNAPGRQYAAYNPGQDRYAESSYETRSDFTTPPSATNRARQDPYAESSYESRADFSPPSAMNRSRQDNYAESSWEATSEFTPPSAMNRAYPPPRSATAPIPEFPPARSATAPVPNFPPTRMATAPIPARGPNYPPQRNLTAPSSEYFDRSGTPSQGPSRNQRDMRYDYDVEGQRDRRY